MFEHPDAAPERLGARRRRALIVVGALLLVVCAIVASSRWDEHKARRIKNCDATTFAQLEEALGAPDAKYGEWKTECWRYQWSDGCRVWCSTDGTQVEEHQGFLLCNMVE